MHPLDLRLNPATPWAHSSTPHLSAYVAGLSSPCTRRPWCSPQGMCSWDMEGRKAWAK